MANIFRGFSTAGRIRAPYTLTDNELVKRDLLNEFYTRRGERVMRPNYGSIIWELLMNPNDVTTREDIRDDVERIVGKDPRVELQNVVIEQLDQTIRVEVTLTILPVGDTDILYLEYTNSSSEEI